MEDNIEKLLDRVDVILEFLSDGELTTGDVNFILTTALAKTLSSFHYILIESNEPNADFMFADFKHKTYAQIDTLCDYINKKHKK